MNAIDTTGSSIRVSLDGYVDSSGNHQVIAGCSGGSEVPGDANSTNIVQLALPGGATPPSYTDLTGPNTINTATLPPFCTECWHARASWQLAVTGMPMIAMHGFVIDPNDGGHFVHCGGDYTSIDVTGWLWGVSDEHFGCWDQIPS